MNNLAQEQLFELLVLFITAIIYIVAHFACGGIAVLISGRKSGLIRGFVQGTLLVGLFSAAIILFFNGGLKAYHLFTYFAIVLVFVKIVNLIKNKLKINLKNIKKSPKTNHNGKNNAIDKAE